MKRAIALPMLIALFAAPALAQGLGPDKALMQKVWAAWDTLNPANPAAFYDKTPSNVYFDISPLKYRGWSEYEAGVKNVLAEFSSIKSTVQPDATVHRQGNLAWSTGTVHVAAVMKDGSKSPLDFRWTAIWEKKGNDWLIVHEHVSAPLPPPPPAKPGTK